MPSLPLYIYNFHSHPVTRVLRIIGGLSLLITLGRTSLNDYTEIPYLILYTLNFISILFCLYMFIINVIKFIHIIKTLKSNDLDVRNSP